MAEGEINPAFLSRRSMPPTQNDDGVEPQRTLSSVENEQGSNAPQTPRQDGMSETSSQDGGRNHASRVYIDNPLLKLTPHQLDRAVKAFAERTGLKNLTDILTRGARVARNPDTYSTVRGITEEEIEVLENETTGGFWQQTKELKVTILTCALGAIVQGWDQASINGANLRWPDDLGLDVSYIDKNQGHVWIFAFVNAAPYLFASLVGAWLSDPLNEYLLGRRAAIFVSALFCFISVIGAACVKTYWEMLACRILLGVGMGAKASVVPVYAAEIAPAHIRGSLVMNWQLFVAFGLFLGFSANLAVFDVPGLHWRLQLAAAALPAIPLLVLIFVCPESPRFLIKKQRWREAYKSLMYFNKAPLLAARELFYINAQIKAETEVYSAAIVNGDAEARGVKREMSLGVANPVHEDAYEMRNATSYWRRFIQLFAIPRIRRATTAAMVVMLGQQLCGVNVIAFYSSSIVTADLDRDAAESEKLATWRRALWMSWGFFLTNFLFAWPAYGNIDKRGRRALLIVTIPGLAVTLLAAAFCFEINAPDAQFAAVTTFIIIFMIFYSPGLGPVPFSYSAEVFPLVNREVGMSFSVFGNLFGAGVLSLFVPFLNNAIKATGLLCIFAALNVLAFVLTYLFVYETKEATLEELNSIFGVPTRMHVRYQVRVVLPWAWRHYVRRSREPRVPSLHVWYQAQRAAAARTRATEMRESGVESPAPGVPPVGTWGTS